MSKRRIGFVFGSFDPIHNAHISMAYQALNKRLVDEVRFVPAKQNPWKKNQTPYDVRLEMVDMATKDLPYVTYDASESMCQSRYTYDVMEYIKNACNEDEELYVITTEETLDEMPRWKNGHKFLMENKFIIVDMPINIHSTNIRNMVKEGEIPLPYVDYKVLQVIVREGLYAKD